MTEERYLPCVRGPRISGGVLKWYAGDVFDLQVHLALTDESGSDITLQTEDTVTFLFRNCCREPVYELTFTDITDNIVVVRFTEPVTALFPKGEYTYDVIYCGAVRRTLAYNAPIRVE